ncbi:unnamed protein product [Linum tenue]|uniref:Uncharacterized protein n=1 Tax=Linum tenue TaxID=586396 RepID=A0AAV0M3A5_9ROSI|nr:unnamed protein product [Linum tenue]
MIRSLPYIDDSLKSLLNTPTVVAIIVDFLGANTLQVAVELDIPPYVFYTCGKFHLTPGLKSPQSRGDPPGKTQRPARAFGLPSCIPLIGQDLLDPFLN